MASAVKLNLLAARTDVSTVTTLLTCPAFKTMSGGAFAVPMATSDQQALPAPFDAIKQRVQLFAGGLVTVMHAVSSTDDHQVLIDANTKIEYVLCTLADGVPVEVYRKTQNVSPGFSMTLPATVLGPWRDRGETLQLLLTMSVHSDEITTHLVELYSGELLQ